MTVVDAVGASSPPEGVTTGFFFSDKNDLNSSKSLKAPGVITENKVSSSTPFAKSLNSSKDAKAPSKLNSNKSSISNIIILR